MTPEERKNLAEQLAANPLVEEITAQMEQDAIDACIWAKTDEDRLLSALRAQTVQTFRQDWQAALANNRARKTPA